MKLTKLERFEFFRPPPWRADHPPGTTGQARAAGPETLRGPGVSEKSVKQYLTNIFQNSNN